MPYALIIKCYLESNLEFRDTSGHHLHAVFFDILSKTDKKTSIKLHSEIGRKAFTISPLFNKEFKTFNFLLLRKKKSNIKNKLGTTSEAWFRVTLLDDTVFPIFSLHFLEQPNPVLRLGQTTLLIKEVRVTGEGKGSWSGFSDYKNLYESAKLNNEIILQFATPTAFKQGDTNILFPIPRLIFKGYIEKWNKYSGIQLDDSIIDEIDSSIILSSYKLKTLPFFDGRVKIPGFAGICKFKIKNTNDKELVRNINLLADFSFFAGTGRKTTHGMGMTRRISPASHQVHER